VVLAALTVVGLVSGIRSAGAAEGMDVLCDRADYGCVEGTGYKGQSYWGANFGRTGHNCTSYVSYLLAKAGAVQPWHTMGNANQWNDKGKGKVPIDDNPTVGSVAQWEGGSRLAPGARGHVGYVEAVTKQGIEITDDSSSGGTRRYRISRGSPYWPDNFIHIFDAAPAASRLTSGTFDLASTTALQALQAGRTGVEFEFGKAGEVPVVGNWDGKKGATVGTFDQGRWTLTNANQGHPAKSFTVSFGERLDIPVVGDWDGDGIDTVGVFHDGTWRLSNTNERKPDVDHTVEFGQAGDLPVVGDWNGDGVDTVGVYRNGTWLLSNGLRATPLPPMTLTFGAEGDLPVVGNWDGVRGDTIGTFNAGTWRLINLNTSTPDDIVELHHGAAGDLPLPGIWDGKRTKLGVAR
jgi:surface antigen